MKVKLFILMLVLVLVTPVMALNYGQDYYDKNLQFALNRSANDPIRGFIGEVTGLLGTGGSNIGTGNIYYVDSNVANEGDGKRWASAKDTLDEAVNLCTADNGDINFIAQGHAEDLSAADAVDIDVAGVTIIGCGSGELRPTYTYTNAAGEIVIGADDVTICNIICNASVTTTLLAIDVEAGAENAKIVGCTFGVDTVTTDEFNNAIVIGDASDGPQIIGCDFRQDAAAAVSAIYLDHDADDAKIIGNLVYGDYSTACIVSDTAASLNILIAENVLYNGTVGGAAGLNTEPCIELLATTAGVIYNNQIFCNVATPDAAIVAADCFLAGNTYSETEGGYDAPPSWLTTDSALNMIGYDDNNNAYSSSNVAANADGTVLERLEQIDVDTSALVGSQGGAGTSGTKAGQTYASVMTATAASDDLFDVDGGAILITSFVGVVTTQIQNQANTCEINLDADTGWTDYDFTTAVDLDNDAAGTRYVFTNVNESVLTPLEGADAGATILMSGWYCGEGMIEQNCSASSTGAIKWYMTWIPYEDGTTVTAQ